jgi:hypothetical protein
MVASGLTSPGKARAGRTIPAESVRPVSRRLPRAAKGAVAAFAACAIAVAAIRSLHSFDHGWWLVAYLSLVGAVSQFGLAWGYLRVVRLESRSIGDTRALMADLLAWNLGTVLVPVGVLASRSTVIVLGSVVLLATLAHVAVQTKAPRSPSTDPWRAWLHAYRALLLFLAGSVVVGTGLAGALPWQ